MMLRILEIETELGAIYTFPDMACDTVKLLVQDLKKGTTASNISFVNVSGAALVLPFRIVKEIRMGKEIVWANTSVA